MKVGCIIQARMGSSRLPGKVLMDIAGKPDIQRVLERVSQIKGLDSVTVAVPATRLDNRILDVVRPLGYNAIMPNAVVGDVLDRYYKAATHLKLDVVMRITADCPLLDPKVSTRVLNAFLRGKYDYVSNVHPPTFPDGLDTEVFTMDTLRTAYGAATHRYDREHVTPYLWKSKGLFKMLNVCNSSDQSHHRWTLDTAEDLEFIRYVYESLGDNPKTEDILLLDRKHTLERK